MKIEEIDIEKLLPYKNNAKKHPDKQIDQLAKSIKQFGFLIPVLISKDYEIICGHGRIFGAAKAGMKKIPCIKAEGLTKTQIKAFRLADNQLCMNTGWDDDILKLEIEELLKEDVDLDTFGFDDDILNIENGEKEIEGKIKFSEFIGEENNYIVLTFNNDIDWLNALSHFELESKIYSKRANGKPWSAGIGRVLKGADYLNKVNLNEK